MEKSNTQAGFPNDRIPPAENPEHQNLLDFIRDKEIAAYRAASSNKSDYKNMLTYSMADTEDFLKATSKDPYYDRGSRPVYYEGGGWLEC
jgi:hypothetical protein